MELKGSLATMSIPNIFQWISDSQKTGSLIVKNQSEEKTIYFKEGRIISASSNLDKDRFGVLIVKQGYVTQDEFMLLMEESKQARKLIGKLCVEKGLFSEEDARGMLQQQTEQIIESIFHRTEGDFIFRESELPAQELVEISIVIHQLFFDSSSKRKHWRRIYSVLGRMDNILVSADRPPDSIATLNSFEQQLITLCNGKNTILDLCAKIDKKDFDICMTLSDLVEKGWLNKIDMKEKADQELQDKLWQTSILLEQKRYLQALLILETLAKEHPDRSDLQSMMEKSQNLLNEEMEGIFFSDDLKPLLVENFDTSKLQPLKLKPQDWYVFSRINGRTPLKELYLITGLGKRATQKIIYTFLSVGAVQMPSQTDIHHKAEPQKPIRDVLRRQIPVAPESPPSGLPIKPPSDKKVVIDKDDSFYTKVKQKKTGEFVIPDHYLKRISEEADEKEDEESHILDLKELDRIYSDYLKKSHYEILNVTPSSTQREIRDSFVKLSKVYHPDMHFSSLHPSVQGRLEELFSLVNHAYRILSNALTRKRYDESLWATDRVKETRSDPFFSTSSSVIPEIKLKPQKTKKPELEDSVPVVKKPPMPEVETEAEVKTPSKQEISEKKKKWNVLFDEAKNLLDEKKYKRASEILEEAVKYNAREKKIYYYLSRAQINLGDEFLDKAEANIKKALILDPENSAFFCQYARIHILKNNLAEAERYVKTSLAWDPYNKEASSILEEIHKLSDTGFFKKLLKKKKK